MSHDSTSTGATASRRTLLRTAAHAAWAVPAIQIASAAPAFATTGPMPITLPPLTDLTATNSWTGVNFRPSASVAYDQAAPMNLQFVFILPVSMVGDAQEVSASQGAAGADWDVALTWTQGTAAEITATRKPNKPILVSPVQLALQVKIKKHDHTSTPIEVHASASNKSAANVAMALA